ncbi:hypothetical protein VTP01DRAFT_8222 [Rhizomucor pusillus]|uniref:uncharacterized protein n=1 Tax=Rhizomucor pusillus TaxID=4840 RepID=UPI00374426AA
MSDLNWCTYCDSAISSQSNSLYCSEECLRADALNHHPLLGYDWHEFKNFPRRTSTATISTTCSSSATSPGLSSTASSSAASSPVPSYTLPSPGIHISRTHRLSPPALELEPRSTHEIEPIYLTRQPFVPVKKPASTTTTTTTTLTTLKHSIFFN